MTYYTLVSIDYADENPQWAIEFGDYDRDCVENELHDIRDHPAREPSQRFKIIRTASDDQLTINAAVAALNGYNPNLIETPVCRHCDRPAHPGYGNCLSCCEEVGGDY